MLAVSPVLLVLALSPVLWALELSLAPCVRAPWAPELSLVLLALALYHGCPIGTLGAGALLDALGTGDVAAAPGGAMVAGALGHCLQSR